MNIKEKQQMISVLETMILEGKSGLLDKSKNINLNNQDINTIKKALFQKSKISKGYDKELFYKMSIKINTGNYKTMFRTLDNHLKKSKPVEPKEVLDYDSIKNIEEREAKPVVITAQSLPPYLREYLNNYVYILDSTLNIVRVYFRHKNEYISNITTMKKIKEGLDKLELNLKIHFLSESKIISNMSTIEKKEFISFLDTY